MRRILIAGSALAVLSLVGWFSARAAAPEAKRDQASAHQDSGETDRALQELRAEVAELRRAAAKNATPNAHDFARPTEAPTEDKDHDVGHEQEAEWSPEVFADNLNAKLATQPVDEIWAREKSAAIEQLFASKFRDGVQLLETTCGSTLCRVSLAHSDSRQREQSVGDLRFEKPFIGDGFARFEDGADGRPRTHIFIAREGHKLDTLGADS